MMYDWKTDQSLLSAAERSDLSGVERALADGADVHYFGDLPLQRAATRQDFLITHRLLEAGADVEGVLRGYQRTMPEHAIAWLRQTHREWLAHRVGQAVSCKVDVIAPQDDGSGGLGV